MPSIGPSACPTPYRTTPSCPLAPSTPPPLRCCRGGLGRGGTSSSSCRWRPGGECVWIIYILCCMQYVWGRMMGCSKMQETETLAILRNERRVGLRGWAVHLYMLIFDVCIPFFFQFSKLAAHSSHNLNADHLNQHLGVGHCRKIHTQYIREYMLYVHAYVIPMYGGRYMTCSFCASP
jgi:hypothetical protein